MIGSLPPVSGGDAPQRDGSLASSGGRHAHPRPVIAIVDDDCDVRWALAELAHSLDYDTCQFVSADALLEAGRANDVDLIISDVHMPGRSGLQLARCIQETATPIILITAFASPEIERQAHAAGVSHFLRKPFDPDVLVEHLDQLLN